MKKKVVSTKIIIDVIKQVTSNRHIYSSEFRCIVHGPLQYWANTAELGPVTGSIIDWHQCVISYTCSQFNSDGSVLKQSH